MDRIPRKTNENIPVKAQFPFLFSVFVAVTKLLGVKLIYKKYKCLEGHPYQVIPIYVYLFHRFYPSLNCLSIRIKLYRFGLGQTYLDTAYGCAWAHPYLKPLHSFLENPC